MRGLRGIEGLGTRSSSLDPCILKCTLLLIAVPYPIHSYVGSYGGPGVGVVAGRWSSTDGEINLPARSVPIDVPSYSDVSISHNSSGERKLPFESARLSHSTFNTSSFFFPFKRSTVHRSYIRTIIALCDTFRSRHFSCSLSHPLDCHETTICDDSDPSNPGQGVVCSTQRE